MSASYICCMYPPLSDKKLYHHLFCFAVHNGKEDALHIKTIKCHLILWWVLVVGQLD